MSKLASGFMVAYTFDASLCLPELHLCVYVHRVMDCPFLQRVHNTSVHRKLHLKDSFSVYNLTSSLLNVGSRPHMEFI